MLNEKQIQGIKNVRVAIEYHLKVKTTFQFGNHQDQQLAERNLMQASRLQWALEQIFTPEELASVV